MSGVVLATLSGVGFGLFQTLNSQAVRQVRNGYLAIYVKVLVAAVVLGGIGLLANQLQGVGQWDRGAVFYFGIAGVVHFSLGWYFLAVSQKKIGAARTGGSACSHSAGRNRARGALGKSDSRRDRGVRCSPDDGRSCLDIEWGKGFGLRGAGWVFATATAWSISSIRVLSGFARVPLIAGAVALGMFAAVIAHTALLLITGQQAALRVDWRRAFWWRVAAVVCVAFATWGRWAALDIADVGVVLALNLVSVPVVLLLAPLTGHKDEPVDRELWAGSAIIIAGALMLILVPSG